MSQYISHYGVKGMKWGVRNFQRSASSLFNRNKERVPEETDPGTGKRYRSVKKARKASAKREAAWERIYLNRSKMNDAELKKALSRLQLENQMQQQVKTAVQLQQQANASKSKPFMKRMAGMAVNVAKVAPPVIDSLNKGTKENPIKNEGWKQASDALKKINKITNSVAKAKENDKKN